MLTVEQISFAYGRRKAEVLHDFSLNIEKGRVYGLLGKNGAGKSTLLHLMSGLLTARKGHISLHGNNVRLRLPETLCDMFLVPEEFMLPSISLQMFVRLNSPFYPRFSEADMQSYLQQFEMDTDVKLTELSMGQKKKVFLSFALATNTSLLIMDEPTNGLDILSKSQFRKLVASGMTEEKTMIISTHQVRDIDKLLDHVIIIDNSRVLLNASTEQICNKFAFVETDNKEMIERAIYSLPSISGHSLMLSNTGGEETDINLEVLFGAALQAIDKINQVFNHSNIEDYGNK